MFLVLVVVLCFYCFRAMWLLRDVQRQRQQLIKDGKVSGSLAERREANATVRTLVVLGSGGHTTEMLTVLDNVNRSRYRPVSYLYAITDARSQERALAVEGLKQNTDNCAFTAIPRSREVYQGWISSFFATLRSLMPCISHVYRFRPDVLLCNGPGTCVPVAAAVFLFNVLLFRKCRIVFVESFCRTFSLSLSGRILYYLSTRFVVQWPQLCDRYRTAEYIGTVC